MNDMIADDGQLVECMFNWTPLHKKWSRRRKNEERKIIGTDDDQTNGNRVSLEVC